MKKSTKFEIAPDTSVTEALRLAIEAERTHFLHELHLYLFGAGFLLLFARAANQYHIGILRFLLGWPTTLLYVVGATTCLCALYLLLHKRSKKFMRRHVSANTQIALGSLSGCASVASLARHTPLTVRELWELHAQKVAE